MRTAVLVMGILTAVAQAQGTVLIDFEATGLAEGDAVTTEVPGLTISGAALIAVGPPSFAYGGLVGEDVVVGGSFGSFFLSDTVFVSMPPGSPTPLIEFAFDAPVSGLSLELADIDSTEEITLQAFDGAMQVLETIVVRTGDPGTGDAIATPVAFASAGIGRVVISQSNPSGFGIDNLQFVVATPSAVVPALSTWAALLLLSTLSVLATLRMRKART